MEYGRAGKIRVEHIGVGIETIDHPINNWLARNPDVEIIDIKFSTNATSDEWGSDALIIYRK